MATPVASHESLAGYSFGHYRILQKLGSGGMGVVYKAEDSQLGRPVALKFIHSHLANDPQALDRFRREARAASALNHPNICTVFDFGKHENRCYIVLEYLEGQSLKQAILHSELSLGDIVQIAIQVASALHAAHSKGIIHRDIKPANIFLTEQSGCKLLDFGLAKLIYSPSSPLVSDSQWEGETVPLSTASGLLVGTVDYMAPEQLQGGKLDERTDLFAFGLVLYEMATGANPFVGRSPTSTMANILKEEPEPPARRNPHLPADLAAIIQRCLQKHPSDRYPSARALLDDLLHVRNRLQLNLPVESGPISSSAGASSFVSPTQASSLAISRRFARTLFMAIQLGYLLMYALALHHLHDVLRVSWELYRTPMLAFLLLGVATLGIPLRIYLFTALTFDFADIGKQFRTLFPFVLVLDLFWAAAPLLFLGQLRGVVLLCAGALAFLPLSQRTLLFEAYGASGGRSSGIRLPIQH